MNINTFSTITLDDGKEYAVASKVEFNDSTYIYILDVDNPKNYKFAEIEVDSVSIINKDEEELLANLLPLFDLDSKKTYDEYLENMVNSLK